MCAAKSRALLVPFGHLLASRRPSSGRALRWVVPLGLAVSPAGCGDSDPCADRTDPADDSPHSAELSAAIGQHPLYLAYADRLYVMAPSAGYGPWTLATLEITHDGAPIEVERGAEEPGHCLSGEIWTTPVGFRVVSDDGALDVTGEAPLRNGWLSAGGLENAGGLAVAVPELSLVARFLLDAQPGAEPTPAGFTLAMGPSPVDEAPLLNGQMSTLTALGCPGTLVDAASADATRRLAPALGEWRLDVQYGPLMTGEPGFPFSTETTATFEVIRRDSPVQVFERECEGDHPWRGEVDVRFSTGDGAFEERFPAAVERDGMQVIVTRHAASRGPMADYLATRADAPRMGVLRFELRLDLNRPQDADVIVVPSRPPGPNSVEPGDTVLHGVTSAK